MNIVMDTIIEHYKMFESIPEIENHYAYLVKIENYCADHRESKINDIWNDLCVLNHMTDRIQYDILGAVWDYRFFNRS